jgi:hypothetical protein
MKFKVKMEVFVTVRMIWGYKQNHSSADVIAVSSSWDKAFRSALNDMINDGNKILDDIPLPITKEELKKLCSKDSYCSTFNNETEAEWWNDDYFYHISKKIVL